MKIDRAHLALSVVAITSATKGRDRHERGEDETRRDARRLLRAILTEERRRSDVTA